MAQNEGFGGPVLGAMNLEVRTEVSRIMYQNS